MAESEVDMCLGRLSRSIICRKLQGRVRKQSRLWSLVWGKPQRWAARRIGRKGRRWSVLRLIISNPTWNLNAVPTTDLDIAAVITTQTDTNSLCLDLPIRGSIWCTECRLFLRVVQCNVITCEVTLPAKCWIRVISRISGLSVRKGSIYVSWTPTGTNSSNCCVI